MQNSNKETSNHDLKMFSNDNIQGITSMLKDIKRNTLFNVYILYTMLCMKRVSAVHCQNTFIPLLHNECSVGKSTIQYEIVSYFMHRVNIGTI